MCRFDRGVLLQAPVLSRIAALFCSSRLPPPLLSTSIPRLKVCLELELLKGHWNSTGHLETYFPSPVLR